MSGGGLFEFSQTLLEALFKDIENHICGQQYQDAYKVITKGVIRFAWNIHDELPAKARCFKLRYGWIFEGDASQGQVPILLDKGWLVNNRFRVYPVPDEPDAYFLINRRFVTAKFINKYLSGPPSHLAYIAALVNRLASCYELVDIAPDGLSATLRYNHSGAKWSYLPPGLLQTRLHGGPPQYYGELPSTAATIEAEIAQRTAEELLRPDDANWTATLKVFCKRIRAIRDQIKQYQWILKSQHKHGRLGWTMLSITLDVKGYDYNYSLPLCIAKDVYQVKSVFGYELFPNEPPYDKLICGPAICDDRLNWTSDLSQLQFTTCETGRDQLDSSIVSEHSSKSDSFPDYYENRPVSGCLTKRRRMDKRVQREETTGAAQEDKAARGPAAGGPAAGEPAAGGPAAGGPAADANAGGDQYGKADRHSVSTPTANQLMADAARFESYLQRLPKFQKKKIRRYIEIPDDPTDEDEKARAARLGVGEAPGRRLADHREGEPPVSDCGVDEQGACATEPIKEEKSLKGDVEVKEAEISGVAKSKTELTEGAVKEEAPGTGADGPSEMNECSAGVTKKPPGPWEKAAAAGVSENSFPTNTSTSKLSVLSSAAHLTPSSPSNVSGRNNSSNVDALSSRSTLSSRDGSRTCNPNGLTGAGLTGRVGSPLAEKGSVHQRRRPVFSSSSSSSVDEDEGSDEAARKNTLNAPAAGRVETYAVKLGSDLQSARTPSLGRVSRDDDTDTDELKATEVRLTTRKNLKEVVEVFNRTSKGIIGKTTYIFFALGANYISREFLAQNAPTVFWNITYWCWRTGRDFDSVLKDCLMRFENDPVFEKESFCQRGREAVLRFLNSNRVRRLKRPSTGHDFRLELHNLPGYKKQTDDYPAPNKSLKLEDQTEVFLLQYRANTSYLQNSAWSRTRLYYSKNRAYRPFMPTLVKHTKCSLHKCLGNLSDIKAIIDEDEGQELLVAGYTFQDYIIMDPDYREEKMQVPRQIRPHIESRFSRLKALVLSAVEGSNPLLQEMLDAVKSLDRQNQQRLAELHDDQEQQPINKRMIRRGQCIDNMYDEDGFPLGYAHSSLRKEMYSRCCLYNHTAPVLVGANEKGRAVYAAAPIYKGDFVCEYRGEILNQMAVIKHKEAIYDKLNRGSYIFVIRHPLTNAYVGVDATEEKQEFGWARLINHSHRFPNVEISVVVVPCDRATSAKHAIRPALIFKAARDISIGEELLIDYGEKRPSVIDAAPWLGS